jgi:predicted ATPase
VLVATAARMEDASPDSRLVLDIAQDPAAVAIRLSALSEDGTGELVRDRMAKDAERAFCAACHRATGGNPLLLQELVKTMQGENIRPDAAHADAIREVGPRAVSRTVLLRLSRLPSDAIAVARAVALLGDGASLPATAALADRRDRLRPARRAGETHARRRRH